MSAVLERFLRYVRFDTQSDERSSRYPSTEGQLVLLRDLVDELCAIGLSDAALDEHGYLMATLPATTTKASVPTIGFIAHVDTSPEMSGADVVPIVHRQYDGRDLHLPHADGVALRLGDVPLIHAQDDARFALLGGTFVGEGALLRFYVLHCVGLPLGIAVLMAVHFWRVRKDGGISGPL